MPVATKNIFISKHSHLHYQFKVFASDSVLCFHALTFMFVVVFFFLKKVKKKMRLWTNCMWQYGKWLCYWFWIHEYMKRCTWAVFPHDFFPLGGWYFFISLHNMEKKMIKSSKPPERYWGFSLIKWKRSHRDQCLFDMILTCWCHEYSCDVTD